MAFRDASNHALDGYYLHGRYLFQDNKFCIPKTSMRDFFIWEIYAGGLSGHFRKNKIIKVVECWFFYSSLKRDIAKLVSRCRICQLAKHRKQNTSLYTLLHVPTCPW